ncbi:hypothetical protein ACIGXA_21790 [Streptomyces fildesensis]|uniref:Uncharacterized protein n=1 Tax=Streptomyces fildesensis TaxID=375757 RepID=A0ABW8C9R5_9ACTN
MRKSPHAAAAADFLAFLTNPANSAKLAQFFPPARSSQLTGQTLAKSAPLLKPAQLQSVVIDGISKGVDKPSQVGMDEIKQTVRAALDPLWKSSPSFSHGISLWSRWCICPTAACSPCRRR